MSNITNKKDDNATLLVLPRNILIYKITSLELKSKIEDLSDYSVEDKIKSIISIDRGCFIKYNKGKIAKELKNIFKKEYKHIKIESVKIFPINTLRRDLRDYVLEKIVLSSSAIKRNRGSFAALFLDKKNKKNIRVYFKYKIDAQIELFKAKNNIINGKILTQNDIKKTVVRFEKVPYGLLQDFNSDQYISKTAIKKDQILTKFNVRKRKLIEKKDNIRAVIKSGAVNIEFFAKALNGGNLGDYIKIKNESGKIFNAKIVSKNEVQIDMGE